tara:strand:+ start:102598 stop:103557 length:960 start_codon:yes stop_codon:yes gene_type:complete
MSLAEKFAKNSKLKGSGTFSKTLEKPVKLYDTGVPALNLAYSGDLFGGTKSGVTCIAGKSKSFKTLFGLIACKAYMDEHPDAYMLFYDSEGGASKEYYEQIGIDTDRVIYLPIMNIEELKFDLVPKLEEIKKEHDEAKKEEDKPRFIVFCDSIGNLASIKEVTDAMNDNSATDMGIRAKTLKALFRIMTPYFKRCEIQMIAIMHTYDEMAAMGAPKQIMSGGCVTEGTRIMLENGDFVEIQNIQEGDMVMSKEGPRKVDHIWDPETLEEGNPECLRLTFDDGYQVECSEKHRFLVKNENGDEEWVMAKDLTEGMDLISI